MILKVAQDQPFKTIKSAIENAKDGDTIEITKGLYKEGNIIIDKPITFLGKDFPILDGELKNEIISIKSDNVTIKGLQLQNSGRMVMSDPGAVKVYDAKNIIIEGNILLNNYFGVYLQYSKHCLIKNNFIKATQKTENQSGNGIHCWKSDSLQIIGNKIVLRALPDSKPVNLNISIFEKHNWQILETASELSENNLDSELDQPDTTKEDSDLDFPQDTDK